MIIYKIVRQALHGYSYVSHYELYLTKEKAEKRMKELNDEIGCNIYRVREQIVKE